VEFFRILLEIGLVRKSILGKMTIRIRLRFVNDVGAFAGISSLMPQTSWIAAAVSVGNRRVAFPIPFLPLVIDTPWSDKNSPSGGLNIPGVSDISKEFAISEISEIP
jgi:hypothetical protein